MLLLFRAPCGPCASRGLAKARAPSCGRCRAAGADPSPSDANSVAALDALVDTLRDAKDDSSLLQLVTANVLALDTKWYLRLAARCDTASEAERARLQELATTTMRLQAALVQRTTAQMSSSSETLTKLLAAAADDGSGAFVLPLRPDRLARVSALLEELAVDEAVLSTAFAWMRKASDDGMDGMVVVLQRVLQLWAARQLAAAPAGGSAELSPAEELLRRLLQKPAEDWDGVLKGLEPSALSGLRALIQSRMEAVVLGGGATGGYAARVKAEFLKELSSRAEA